MMARSNLSYKQVKFIEINHHFYTAKEMAREVRADGDDVRNLCKRMGWKCITKLERLKEITASDPGLSPAELARKTGMSVWYVQKLCDKNNLPYVIKKGNRLPKRKQKNES